MTLTCHCTIKQDCTDVSVVCSAVFTKMQCTGTGAVQCSVPCTGGVVKSQLSPEFGPHCSAPYSHLLPSRLTIQTLSTCEVQILDCHSSPSGPHHGNHAKPECAKFVRKRCYNFFPRKWLNCATWVWLDFPTGIIDSVIFCNFQLLRPWIPSWILQCSTPESQAVQLPRNSQLPVPRLFSNVT